MSPYVAKEDSPFTNTRELNLMSSQFYKISPNLQSQSPGQPSHNPHGDGNRTFLFLLQKIPINRALNDQPRKEIENRAIAGGVA